MSDEANPLLERTSDRRRRITDVACLAPVFGLGLLVLPALWGDESRTAPAMIYVFSVWAVLIFVMVVISRRLSVSSPSGDAPERDT